MKKVADYFSEPIPSRSATGMPKERYKNFLRHTAQIAPDISSWQKVKKVLQTFGSFLLQKKASQNQSLYDAAADTVKYSIGRLGKELSHAYYRNKRLKQAGDIPGEQLKTVSSFYGRDASGRPLHRIGWQYGYESALQSTKRLAKDIYTTHKQVPFSYLSPITWKDPAQLTKEKFKQHTEKNNVPADMASDLFYRAFPEGLKTAKGQYVGPLYGYQNYELSARAPIRKYMPKQYYRDVKEAAQRRKKSYDWSGIIDHMQKGVGKAVQAVSSVGKIPSGTK